MKWIDVEERKPESVWHIVFVTDGEFTCLARWIGDPVEWYGKDLMIWDDNLEDEVPLEEEWHEPHWEFQTEIGPFIGNNECFGFSGEVSHWMPLPLPPNNIDLK